MPLVQLIYVSSAKELFTKTDLLCLLSKSRARNTALNVTGLLLYKDGNFLQVLEGEETVIQILLARIREDPRHAGVIILLAQPIEARDFPDWSMAFHDLDDPALRVLPGFNEFLNLPLSAESFETDPSKAKRLISIFRASMR